MSLYHLIVQLCVCFAHVVPFVYSDDILGCGGFVKSEVKINFSLIEVKLYTKQGSLKYQTDCAPNTGYYMIPVYDKGDYVLKVEPPPGWTFDPSSVDLHIDGETDACSKSEDINFRFTGFGVVGKVLTKGSEDGPSGVTLTLTKKESVEAIKMTTSAVGGGFTFENVLPGEYIVKASHPTWTFVMSSVAVHVGHETGRAGTSLEVFGYDVKGAVFSDGEPVKGVHFLLFSPEQQLKETRGCDTTAVAGFPTMKGYRLLCHVASQRDGSFLFPSVPLGQYSLMPFYKGKHINFDVLPAQLKIAVEHNSVAVKEVFQVAGFSVSGRVITKTGGVGVAGASILLNGKHQTTTSTDGRYQLDSLKAGQYSISVTARQLEFKTVSVKITPNTPHLPDVVVSRFETCGKIVIDKVPESLAGKTIQKLVEVHSRVQGKAVKKVVATDDGSFCQMLTPGSYVFKVILGKAELQAGLKLAPVEKEVQVIDAPVSGIVFSQFRAKVSGVVTCIEECSQIDMTLTAVDHTEDQVMETATSGGKATFQFVDIMPGKYKLTVNRDEWCWNEKTTEIEVTDKDVTDVTFSQSGYVFSCSLSHDVTLNFERQRSTAKYDIFSEQMMRGVNKLCLRKPGTYQLTPVSCHQFEQDTYSYDTSHPAVLSLSAVRHQVAGVIVTQQRQDDIIVTVTPSGNDAQPSRIGPLKVAPEDASSKGEKSSASKKFTYPFTYWGRSGEVLDISAASSVLLFYPSSAKVTLQGDTCPGASATLEGRQGVFISGTIQPAIKGVQILITSEDNELSQIALESGDKGEYRVGPLDADSKYRVTAEKDGYMFSAIDGKYGNFKAFKLAEIAVEVSDERGEPLQGVLMSLSGGDSYRSNSLSQADGKKSFLNLSPGQYFLRPMMKEYKFDPVSRMIDVLEGSTVNVKISSTRIAFSCYGLVTSLVGDSEPGVFVEAVGAGSCTGLQEESKTEQDGSFRIRGLQPECDYIIRLRSGNDVNQHIERAAPREKNLKITTSDVTGVHIIAFRRTKQLDLSGNVVTPPEHLSTVKVTLYNEKNLDSPLHTVTLGPSSFFYLPSLIMDGQTYVVQLDSTLSKSVYKYAVTEVSFVANTSYKHFTFQFEPKRKSVEQELNTGSYMILPFTVAVIFIVYNYQKVLPFLMHCSDVLKNFATGSHRNAPSTSRGSTPPIVATDTSSYSDNGAGAAKKKQKMRKT